MAEHLDEEADTRQRLLEAAGEVFADKGYEKATIREIVDRAKANLNAVNYYFRDKHSLYLALFDHARLAVGRRDRDEFAKLRELPAEERFRAFILHIFRGFDMKIRSPWQMRLMMREMTEPTGAMDILIDRLIRPRFEFMVEIVSEIAGPELPRHRAELCAEHVIATCIHLVHGRPIVSKLIPSLDYSPKGIEAAAKHIAAFCLAAIRNITREELLP